MSSISRVPLYPASISIWSSQDCKFKLEFQFQNYHLKELIENLNISQRHTETSKNKPKKIWIIRQNAFTNSEFR